MKWGTFLFFAGWVVIMTIFVILCVPETKVRADACVKLAVHEPLN